jgi:hypothetical protein
LNRDNTKKKKNVETKIYGSILSVTTTISKPRIHTHKRTQNALNITSVAGRRKHKLTYLTDVEKSASRRQCLAWHGSRPDENQKQGKIVPILASNTRSNLA